MAPPRVTPNALDRLIGWANPAAGLRRVAARDLLTRAYEGANPRDGWKPRRAGASANADVLGDGARLRHRARALVQNVPYVHAGVESLVSHTIGPQIMPRLRGPGAERAQALLARWMDACDADGQSNFAGLVAMVERAALIDGDALIRLRPRRRADGLPIPLQLQVQEIDWLDTSKTGTAGPGPDTITMGVQRGPTGRVTGYWLHGYHPGDVSIPRGASTASRFVPAAGAVDLGGVLHYYEARRPGQVLGITALATIIARTRDLQLYEDAEIARKNLETRLSVLYSGDAAALAPDPDAEQAARQTGHLGELASGSINQLPAGGSLTVVEPKAAPGYVDYVSQQLHLIAAGLGVSYEMLTGDMSGVNYSSARVRLLQFQAAVEARRWQVVAPRLLTPILRAALRAAELDGSLQGTDALSIDWSFPRWQYVDPQKDIAADIAEISSGLSSWSEKIRARGYDPQAVFAEYQQDIERLNEGGALNLILQLLKGQPQRAAEPPGSAGEPGSQSLSHRGQT